MIEVIYYREKNRVSIRGHAFSGEAGHDLVCAGVSALAYTLAANVGNMEDQGQAKEVKINLDKGHGVIRCKAVEGCEDMVRRIFEAVCVGFEVMAINFPKNISYSVR